MRRSQFSIIALMGIVSLFAVWIAAFVSLSDTSVRLVFSTTALVLIASTFRAATSSGEERPWWLGFAVIGWAHMLLRPNWNTGEVLVTDWAAATLIEWCVPHLRHLLHNSSDLFMTYRFTTLIHDVLSIFVALVGAWLITAIAAFKGWRRPVLDHHD